jgi:hypothetical protein
MAATIANEHMETLRAEGARQAAALTGGFNWAFGVGVGFALIGIAVSAFVLRRADVPSEAAATVGPA